MTNNTFGANGSAKHIPVTDDLWLVVRSGIEGWWYPVARLVVARGRWAVGKDSICPASGPHDVEVFMVPNSDESQFFTYVRSKAKGEGLGISSVPPMAVLEAISHIDVPSNAEPSC